VVVTEEMTMGVRIMYDPQHEQAALYCSTTDWAFGPVVGEHRDFDKDPAERLEAFCRWLVVDARSLTDSELAARYSAWLAQEATQYARERLEVLAKDEDLLVEGEVAELADLRERFAS
jgi:hypothetical protein